jgi:hypothetical protein
MAKTYIPNPPAPERAGGEYTGNPITAVLGGPTGHQPGGDNNPLGDNGSVPVMSLTADALATLCGSQPPYSPYSP